MAWNRRYSLRSYVRSSLWIVPVLALITALVINYLTEQLGGWMVRQGFYDLQTGFFAVNAAEAHAILDRIFTVNLSCLVFTFGSLLVAVQVAGGQYTPRIIATTLLCDNVIRWITGLFVFTLLWAHWTMVELGQEAHVPQLQVFLGTLFGLASLIAFIVLIDYAAKLLRPISLVRRVSEQGIVVIDSVYPYPTQPRVSHWTRPCPGSADGGFRPGDRGAGPFIPDPPRSAAHPIVSSITRTKPPSCWP